MITAHQAPPPVDAGPRDASRVPLHDIGDPDRLTTIRRLALRGHLGDADLDAIVATVADACDVPVAVVNIVTPGRQTYPAERGVGAPSTAVADGLSFCAEVV